MVQIKNMRSDKMGRFLKNVSLSIEGFAIVKGFFLVALVITIFKYLIPLGVPSWIGYLFGGCFTLILVLKIIGFIKLVSTKLDADVTQEIEDHFYNGNHKISLNEKLDTSILGIMRTGSIRGGWIFFGTGNLPHPENAILITKNYLLFVYVPFSGGDKMLNGTNMQITGWLFSSEDLEKKLQDELSQQSLNNFFHSYPKNFAIRREDIEKMSFKDSQQGIVFDVLNQEKLRYSIKNKEEYDKAKSIFSVLKIPEGRS